MTDDTAPLTAAGPAWKWGRCRFEPAPPRNFLYPAILLLVRERPGNGYGLIKRLHHLTFGKVDRPTVYRTLAKLEAERLLESWRVEERTGSPSTFYGITAAGAARLEDWMHVVAVEARLLAGIVERYRHATSSPDGDGDGDGDRPAGGQPGDGPGH